MHAVVSLRARLYYALGVFLYIVSPQATVGVLMYLVSLQATVGVFLYVVFLLAGLPLRIHDNESSCPPMQSVSVVLHFSLFAGSYTVELRVWFLRQVTRHLSMHGNSVSVNERFYDHFRFDFDSFADLMDASTASDLADLTVFGLNRLHLILLISLI